MDVVDFSNATKNMSGPTKQYFQSSFARSIAFQTATQCKSFDSDYIRNDFKENNNSSSEYCDYTPGCGPVFANISKSANISPVKSFTDCYGNKTSNGPNRNSSQHQVIQEQLTAKDEIQKLRAECQTLAEENKKLQRLSLQSTNANASLLQSQLDSLQWQLRQTESSKQMYRAVMEQVSKFLERVHKNLDTISSRMSSSPKTKTSRFPRSRSVHTMAGTCASGNSSSSRCSSPSPTHYSTISNSSKITNSSTVDQLHELDTSPQHSLNNSFAEYSWKPSRPVPEYVTLDKLSQESFRFHRTVQSLLNTPEPDILHRLTPAVSEVTLPDSNEKMDNTSVGSCASLYEATCVDNRKSLDTSSSHSMQFSSTDNLKHNGVIKGLEMASTKVVSTEDESGFSSMSSFHDVNIGYPKLGLPIDGCEDSKHRRWTSTPVNKMYDSNLSVSFCDNEILRVLWV